MTAVDNGPGNLPGRPESRDVAEARIRAWWARRTPEQKAADWAVEHRLAAIEKEHQP